MIFVSGKMKSTHKFIEDAIKIHGDKYDYSDTIYKGAKIPIKIKCKKNHDFYQKPNDHLNGFGCRICSGWGVLKNDKNEFILRALKIHGNKYDYSNSIYENHSKPLTIFCSKHGFFQQTPKSHIISKSGCPKCGYERSSNIKSFNKDKFIKNATEIHGLTYGYSKVEYINMNTKIIITCFKHGDFIQSPKDHIHQHQGCPTCGISKGELKIRQWLINNNIEFIPQYTFDNCKNKNKLPFDFYLPQYNICIEFDGEQHFKISKRFGGVKTFTKIQINDKIKNNFCKENNIKLIRIPFNKIKNINKILNNLLWNN